MVEIERPAGAARVQIGVQHGELRRNETPVVEGRLQGWCNGVRDMGRLEVAHDDELAITSAVFGV